MTLKVVFRSLGCKLNQLETESVADSFAAAGAWVLGRPKEAGAGRGADLVILNSCTVTGKAEQKARRLAREALAADPEAAVLVTGCYAQLGAAELEALDSRVVALPGEHKDALLGLAAWLGDSWAGHGNLAEALREWRAGLGGRVPDRFAFSPESFAFHSRPALKVQDGCGNRCSYCRVRLARGAPASLPAALAVERARALEEAGAAEIVLTGVNLSQYRDGDRGFPGLLAALLAGTGRVAFRISSFEPDRIDEAFLELFAEPRVRPHAHLPVQSGSDAVLARMARPYRRGRVLGACEALRRARGDPFLACDLIVGFPGETEEDFAATADLALACGFAWIHAFPFSPRPGTAAFDMRPRVPERVAGERAAVLGELAQAGKAAYAARWVGAEVEAVVEGPAGELRATTENYLKIKLGAPAGPAPRPGEALRCTLAPPTQGGPEDAFGVLRALHP